MYDYDLIVRDAQVVNPDGITKTNIFIKDGKVRQLDEVLPLALLHGRLHDADGQGVYVLPGIVDAHVHFRVGQPQKATFATESMAALAGGITTVGDMPNAWPTLNTELSLRTKLKRIGDTSYVDYFLYGLGQGIYNSGQLKKLAEAGVGDFKLFLGYGYDDVKGILIHNYKKGMAGVISPPTKGELLAMCLKMKALGITLSVHAEHTGIIADLTNRINARPWRKWPNDYEKLLASRSHSAETGAISYCLEVAEKTGVKMNICHVSTARGVEMIARAKRRDLDITAEASPHYLFFTNRDFDKLGPLLKCFPLIKQKEDRAALWEGLRDGTIDSIGSDHAPHAWEEKYAGGDLSKSQGGIIEVQTMLPMMLDAANRGQITLPELAKLMSANPAKIHNLHPQKGAIEPGADADFVIVDMDAKHRIKNEELHNLNKISPYDGLYVRGKVRDVFKDGALMVKDGRVVKNASQSGRWLQTRSR
ncbi:MAG: dihydroorotase family protein [Rickettsiales bacterium]|jgi:allantoinase|nr:dihydroorotase family protein [Rickettsiales bacterium]